MRPQTNRSILLASFDAAQDAVSASAALRHIGVEPERIGLIVPGKPPRDAVAAKAPVAEAVPAMDATTVADVHPGAWSGVISGGIAGGILATAVSLAIPGVGPLLAAGVFATFLGGTAVGAAAGGLVGMLRDLDVPEAHRQWSQQQVQAGKTLLSVDTRGETEAVHLIIQRHGGRVCRTTDETIDETGPSDPLNPTRNHPLSKES